MKRGRKPKQEQFINALEEVFNDVEESTVEEPTIKVIDKEVLLRDYIFKILQMANSKQNSIILDFFAGSGTTFEAVNLLNKKDGGSRKCLLVQKDEAPQKDSAYKTIADLCWNRICKNADEFGEKVERVQLKG